jgi:hypothetical protein
MLVKISLPAAHKLLDLCGNTVHNEVGDMPKPLRAIGAERAEIGRLCRRCNSKRALHSYTQHIEPGVMTQ